MKRTHDNYHYDPPPLDFSDRLTMLSVLAFLALLGGGSLLIVVKAVWEEWR